MNYLLYRLIDTKLMYEWGQGVIQLPIPRSIGSIWPYRRPRRRLQCLDTQHGLPERLDIRKDLITVDCDTRLSPGD